MTPTKDKILKFVDETLAEISDVSEEWTDTLPGKLLDIQQAKMIKCVEKEDFKGALRHLADVAQTLNHIEELEKEWQN